MNEDLKAKILDGIFYELSQTRGDWDLEENGITYACVAPQVGQEHELYTTIVATPQDAEGEPVESKARFFRLTLIEVTSVKALEPK